MKQPVAVFIPVYNAFDEAHDCLQSVLDTVSSETKIFVIDDASPEGDFREYITERGVSLDRVIVKRQDENLGFVGTANRGFEELQGYDVALVNSDTIVTPRWLEKLGEAAYSSRQVGTVSPFTNNGAVTSIPDYFEVNTLPPGYSPEAMNELVERLSQRVYPELPSCVGCCLYIKREVLERVGYFDQETFSKGYGEENDFSLRMRELGYIDILDDATFIYHKGDASFGEEKKKLVERNTKILQKRYPRYFEDVRKFRAHNPLASIHRPIHEQLFQDWEGTKSSRILHILHNGPTKKYRFAPGGTEKTVADLISQLPEYAHYSLVFWENTYCLTAHLPGWQKEFFLPAERVEIGEILNNQFFDLVHLHHTTPLAIEGFSDALKAHGNYQVSIHDYVLACPRYYLLTPKQKLCNGHECVATCGYQNSFIEEYRSVGRDILENAKRIIVFSQSSKNYLKTILTIEDRVEHVPHGSAILKRDISPQENEPETLRILLLGVLARHKGLAVLEELFSKKVLISGKRIEWHIVGDTATYLQENVFTHGRYEKGELEEILSDIKPHLALFCSHAAETYSLTVDEALVLGVPAIVSPNGAPTERIRSWGAGWVLEALSTAAVISVLEEISSSWETYLEVKARTLQTPIPMLVDEVEYYANSYSAKGESTLGNLDTLLTFLYDHCVQHIGERRFMRRLAGKLLGGVVVTSERLGLRDLAEYLFTRYVPQPLQYKIKKTRISSL